MEYCTVHNSTDDATFAAQKKIKGLRILFVFILSHGFIYAEMHPLIFSRYTIPYRILITYHL
jgi:hypothetical protein